MKILFSKKMAFVYGGLSICALIGFIVVMNIATNYGGLILPISVIPIKPIIYMVHPFFFQYYIWRSGYSVSLEDE